VPGDYFFHLGQVSVKEVVFDSSVADILWMGQDNKILLLRTAAGRIYRSVDSGEVWNDITDTINGNAPYTPIHDDFSGTSIGSHDPQHEHHDHLVAEQLIQNPKDRMMVLVVGANRKHFLTVDGGNNWRDMKTAMSQIHR
jgi:photosystem II stability/assembly factor-like uncharacterized protein